MKKYTVICHFVSGTCHNPGSTVYYHIETDNLRKTLDTDDRFTDVQFVFDGWLEVSNDWLTSNKD